MMERLAEAVILPAGPGDADALAKVHVDSWRQTYPGLLPQTWLDAMSVGLHARRWRLQLTREGPPDVVLAAEGRGGLIGYCAGAVTGSQAEVYTLYLVRSAQRQGLGRKLLTSTARVLAARGATSLSLWVLNGNTPAEAFYARLGGRRGDGRLVKGWGGGLIETAYRWDDIGDLTSQS